MRIIKDAKDMSQELARTLFHIDESGCLIRNKINTKGFDKRFVTFFNKKAGEEQTERFCMLGIRLIAPKDIINIIKHGTEHALIQREFDRLMLNAFSINKGVKGKGERHAAFITYRKRTGVYVIEMKGYNGQKQFATLNEAVKTRDKALWLVCTEKVMRKLGKEEKIDSTPVSSENNAISELPKQTNIDALKLEHAFGKKSEHTDYSANHFLDSLSCYG